MVPEPEGSKETTTVSRENGGLSGGRCRGGEVGGGAVEVTTRVGFGVYLDGRVNGTCWGIRHDRWGNEQSQRSEQQGKWECHLLRQRRWEVEGQNKNPFLLNVQNSDHPTLCTLTSVHVAEVLPALPLILMHRYDLSRE